MRRYIGIVVFVLFVLSTKGEMPVHYFQKEIIIQNDLVYGAAVNYKKEQVLLKLDAYYTRDDSHNKPVMIFIHGGGFGAGDKGFTPAQGDLYPRMAKLFAREGFVVFCVNYRLWPNYPENLFPVVFGNAVEDVNKAVEWIKSRCIEFGIDTTKLFVCGDSAGGSLAVEISYNPPSGSPFAGCIDLWGGLPPYGTKQNGIYSRPLGKWTPPTCFIHGTADSVVLYKTSLDLYNRLKRRGVYSEMHALPGKGHYPQSSSELFLPLMINFVSHILGNRLPVESVSGGLCMVEGLDEHQTAGENNLRLLRDAAKSLKASGCPGLLMIPRGLYLLSDKGAVNAFDSLMQGKLDPRSSFSDNYTPYYVALSFSDIDSLIIDGQGSTLIFDGLIQPFSFRNCKNIVLRNFKIDWKRPLFTEGMVTAVKDNVLEVKVFPEYPIQGGEPVVSFQNFIPSTGRLGGVCPFSNVSSFKKIDPATVQVMSDDAKFIKPGEIVIFRHIYEYRPGFDLFNTQNIRFNDITIYSLPGMGIFATRCKNILIRGLKVMPSGKHIMSGNVDATHFISCEGTVEIDSSYFEGMGDDALNVHGYYYTVKQKIDAFSLLMFIAHSNDPDEKMKDYPSKGDRIEFIHKENLFAYDSAVIDSVYFDEQNNESFIRLSNPLPPKFSTQDLIANVTRLPKLVFTNNTVRNIRGRGVLVQTRDALIEHNSFEGCTGQAIHVNTAYPWMESAGTRNIRIRSNRFIDCGMGNTTYCDATAIVVETESAEQKPGVHKNILIEDNLIIGGDKPALYLSSVDSVCIRMNRVINKGPAAMIKYSDNIRFEKNDFNGANVIIGPGCKQENINYHD